MENTKKIEGFVDMHSVNDPTRSEFKQPLCYQIWPKEIGDDVKWLRAPAVATLILGPGYTEAEVRAMLDKLENEARRLFLLHISDMKPVGQQAGLPSTSFNNDIRAAKHGITL